jgi:hypothetical protein
MTVTHHNHTTGERNAAYNRNESNAEKNANDDLRGNVFAPFSRNEKAGDKCTREDKLDDSIHV